MAVEVVRCPHCQSGEVGQYGTAATGTDRCRCQHAAQCGRTFIRASPYQGRVPQGKRPSVERTLKGSGGREIARVLQISPNTVIAG